MAEGKYPNKQFPIKNDSPVFVDVKLIVRKLNRIRVFMGFHFYVTALIQQLFIIFRLKIFDVRHLTFIYCFNYRKLRGCLQKNVIEKFTQLIITIAMSYLDVNC